MIQSHLFIGKFILCHWPFPLDWNVCLSLYVPVNIMDTLDECLKTTFNFIKIYLNFTSKLYDHYIILDLKNTYFLEKKKKKNSLLKKTIFILSGLINNLISSKMTVFLNYILENVFQPTLKWYNAEFRINIKHVSNIHRLGYKSEQNRIFMTLENENY